MTAFVVLADKHDIVDTVLECIVEAVVDIDLDEGDEDTLYSIFFEAFFFFDLRQTQIMKTTIPTIIGIKLASKKSFSRII